MVEKQGRRISTIGTPPNTGHAHEQQRAGRQHTLRERWRAVSLNNKLIVVFAGLTTVATVVYSGFAGWQLYEIHSGSQDTHMLAEAAKRQADKAETISTSISNAVKELHQQAKATQDSVRAIQKQTRLAEGAWVVITMTHDPTFAENQPLTILVTFKNVGKTGARKIVAEAVVEVVKNGSNPTFDYRWDHSKSTEGWLSANDAFDVLAVRLVRKRTIAGTVLPLLISHQEYEDFADGRAYLATYARVTYEDTTGTPHWTHYCMWTNNGLSNVGQFTAKKCTDYRGADNN